MPSNFSFLVSYIIIDISVIDISVFGKGLMTFSVIKKNSLAYRLTSMPI